MGVSQGFSAITKPGIRELSTEELSLVFGGETVPIWDSRNNVVVAMDTNMIVNWNGQNETLTTVLDNLNCAADITAAVATDGAIGWFDGTTMFLDCGQAAYDDWNLLSPIIDEAVQAAEDAYNQWAQSAGSALSSLMFCPDSMDPGTWDFNYDYNPFCS